MHPFHTFEDEEPPPKKRRAMLVWAIASAILIMPSLIVWIVRGIGFALHCAPGPDLCRNLPLGFVLHQALDLCWLIASDSFVGVALGFVAAVAALISRRPLLASLSMLILPVASLALPTMAVFYSLYSGCQPSESGIGDCVVWGNHMGMAFHRAAAAPGLIDDFVAYVFALAVMIAILGFAFFRPRRA